MSESEARTIREVLSRFERTFPPETDEKRSFHGVYYRNTLAVQERLDAGSFLDPAWVDRWDVVFAELYLDALEAWNRDRQPSAPWRVAFEGARDPAIRPLVHVLVAMNAHINYDLPQSLLSLMSDEEISTESSSGAGSRTSSVSMRPW